MWDDSAEHSPSQDLVWVKPRWFRREFELRAGEAVLGTLVWKRGSQAIAQWAENRYRFDRKGWFNQRIIVHTDTSGQETSEALATFTPRSGILTVSDGRTFVWKKPQRTSTGRRWNREHIWVDASGTELARFRPLQHSSVGVIMPQMISAQPELPLLTLLGQYLIALAAQDAETASMAGTVAVIASS